MAAVPYREWLARGLEHQKQNRPIDAMLCYERAVRAAPQAVDPRFHLGEVLWQIGRLADALNAWREALRVAPQNIHVLLPLAEALLAAGNAGDAHEITARALAVAPDEPRAQLLDGVARLALANADDRDGVEELLRALQRAPHLFAVPTLGGPLALALQTLPDRTRGTELLAALARLPDVLAGAPALLLALVVEYAMGADAADCRRALLRTAADRGYAADEHDPLRRIAHVAAVARDDAAQELAEFYAKLCVHHHSPPYPLCWPRRCAGERLRIVVVVGPAAGDVEASWLSALAEASESDCEVTLALLGAAQAPALPQLKGPRALSAFTLPPAPQVADARRIALLDPDVLVDLAGLAATVGPVLVQRPARAVVTAAGLRAANVPPLVDAALAGTRALREYVATARAALDRSAGAALDPQAMKALWEQAVRAHQQEDRAAARAHYDRILDLQPQFAPAHHLRGVLDRDDGLLDAARADFAAALGAAPAYADARVAAAKLALDMGDPTRAETLCAEGVALTPGNVDLLRTHGLALLACLDPAAAVDRLAAAIAIVPTDADTHYNHGVALQSTRKYEEASRAYQRALAFAPDLVAAHFNLGVIFQEQENANAAIAAYTNVIERDPTRVAAYRNLGEVLFGLGRVDAWFANFRRFEARCPDALALAVQALEVLQHQGNLAGVDRYLEGLRREQYRAADATELCDSLEQLLYLLLFFDVEPELILRFARTYDTMAPNVYGSPIALPAVRRPGKIRVGYLSADLRNHVMGKMVWQALAHHDRSRFALHFYSNSAQRDDWTERFAGIAERFAVIAGMGDREATRTIAADDLDILVDLSTHTRGARPGILARKPARVTITHVASAGTVGLSAIDFKLTDHFADIAANQADQIETLLPMAGCVYPFRRVAAATTHPFHRRELNLSADAVLIGAFVTPLKLGRRCLALWREVLERVPRARLVFSPTRAAFADSYRRLAAAGGIAADRLVFIPQGRDDAENQARYALIDYVLDPMPYGGVNGTIEALDMGVPVVTLVGRRHSERTSYSMLANLGVEQTIAQSGPEYVEIAVRLAEDPAFVREVRAAIVAGLARSALTDAVGHTRNLEAAYVEALRRKAAAALREAEEG
jgi:predicted O-linked N-acetylglucosamine transferase (SPINDLY family)